MNAGMHHVAYACRDVEATHRFYHEVLELELVHVELNRFQAGWFRHLFYDLGGGAALAFFDLHGCGEPSPLKTSVSTDLGLPLWVNHLALRVDDATQKRLREKLVAAGHKIVMDFDHGWCFSVYVRDPNGILVELCADKPGGIPIDPAEALRRMRSLPEGVSS